MTEKKQENVKIEAKTLDLIRSTGFRPTVVVCLIHNRKFLLLFRKDYSLWMMPQSGIAHNATPESSVLEAITEDMGKEFLELCDKKSIFPIGHDQVEFLPEKQPDEKIISTDGKEYKMIGKHYFFYAIPVKAEDFDLTKTQFQESYWFDYKAGLILASKIYQSGKRRITMKAIALMKEKGLID